MDCRVDVNIGPQTQRVNDGRRTLANRKQALEFLIHFIGDITQPLHDEAEALGGNQIPVTWKGDPTNLHATWDTQMVEQDAGGGNTTAVLMAFASKLEAAINTGAYSSQKASWVKCANVATAVCWVFSSEMTLFVSFVATLSLVNPAAPIGDICGIFFHYLFFSLVWGEHLTNARCSRHVHSNGHRMRMLITANMSSKQTRQARN